MALLRSPPCEGESGGPLHEHDSLRPAVLYPPSYFETRVAALPAEGDGGDPPPVVGWSPASTYVVSRQGSPGPQLQHRVTCSEQEDAAALRRENEALRSQLQQTVGHTAPSATLLPPCLPHCSPAILSSDLLQVERGLQSRLAHLEAERQRLADQLAATETTLRGERARHSRDQETLIAQHCVKLEEVGRERGEVEGRWRRECEEWRERVERAEEREKEKAEELSCAQEKLACMTQEKTELCGELEQERRAREEEVTSLEVQLSSARDHSKTIEGELEAVQCRVDRLESYLGGDLPEEGVTWREERATLLDRISECEADREKAQREAQLMAVRLAAISEVLTLQEKALMQGKGEGMAVPEKAGSGAGGVSPPEGGGGGGGGRGGGEGLKSVLTLWREKVFALLVQARVTEMQHRTLLQEALSKVCSLEVEVSEAQRERDLVSHTLTDRTAQLQLLTTRTEELERCVQKAEEDRMASQETAEGLSAGLQLALSGVRERRARLKSCLDGCLSRLANYQQRVGVVCGRAATLRAVVGSQMVLGSGKIARDIPQEDDVTAGWCDVTTQTESLEQSQELSKLPQPVLVEEVVTLMRERDTLSRQLSQSTASLQQLKTSGSERQEALEQTCSALTADNGTLREQLEAARSELEGLREREAQLHSTQASLQARVDQAVMAERRKGRQQLSEAQALLDLARREQAKTALLLQRSERKLEEERAGAAEAVEMARQGLEEELARCRDRLRAVQVERNLLLTTLRQEGIKVPPRKPTPRRVIPHHISLQPQQAAPSKTHRSRFPSDSEMPGPPLATARDTYRLTETENGHSVGVSLSSSPSPSDGAPARDLESEGGRSCEGDGGEMSPGVGAQRTETVNGTKETPPHPPTNNRQSSSEEDIQNVLKELQLLSTALLDMNAAS